MSPLCSCPLYLRSQRKQLQPLVPRRGQGSQDAQQTEHGRGPHINKRGDKPKSTQQINQTNVSHRVLHKAGASGNRGSYGQRRLAKAESSRYFSRTSQYSNVHGTSLRGIKCSISQIHFFFLIKKPFFTADFSRPMFYGTCSGKHTTRSKYSGSHVKSLI